MSISGCSRAFSTWGTLDEMSWRITAAALAWAPVLCTPGCHKHASPAPNAEQAPSARQSPVPPGTGSVPLTAPTGSAAPGGSAAPAGSAAPTGSAALVVHTQDLTAPVPGAVPSKLDVQATKGGLVVEMIEGLACDGSWKWRAHRTGSNGVTVRLSDENHSSMRTSCARMVHQRVAVSGLAPGTYHVHVRMPTGYGSLDRTVKVSH